MNQIRISRFLWSVSLSLILAMGIVHAVWAAPSPASSPAPTPAAVSTRAEAAALIDVQSGRVLYAKQGDKQMRIASLTKIMTAIVAIEQGTLSDIVKVSRNAAGKEGSSIYLKEGEEMSLHNLLYGLMLRSGNDAATAIAEHIGGSIEGFAYLMNQQAELLGMDHSHFQNPSGLDEAGHYSTANDMAKLTAYALRNPAFQDIVKTKEKSAPNPNEPWDYKWRNKNKMLTIYEGADGVKTGYTKLALRCLVSSATRGGQQLAVVTLNDSDDWNDHTKLLNYGFSTYPLNEIVTEGDRLEGQTVTVGRSFRYPLKEEEKTTVRKEAVLANSKSPGYAFGDRGFLRIYVNDTLAGTVPLYEANSPRMQSAKKEQASFSYVTARGSWPAALKLAWIRLLSAGSTD